MSFYPLNTDVKMPVATEDGSALDGLSWGILAHYQSAPAAVSGSAIISAYALSGSAMAVAGSAIHQPDVARALSVVGSGSAVSGSAVITGKDVSWNDISETLAMNGVSTVQGTKAFRRVDGVMTPAGSGLTFSVGVTKKIGLPFSTSASALCLAHLFDGATDAGALSLDDSDVALNTYTPAGTLDGVKLMDYFGMVR